LKHMAASSGTTIGEPIATDHHIRVKVARPAAGGAGASLGTRGGRRQRRPHPGGGRRLLAQGAESQDAWVHKRFHSPQKFAVVFSNSRGAKPGGANQGARGRSRHPFPPFSPSPNRYNRPRGGQGRGPPCGRGRPGRAGGRGGERRGRAAGAGAPRGRRWGPRGAAPCAARTGRCTPRAPGARGRTEGTGRWGGGWMGCLGGWGV